jgi:hypothetical protein
MKLDEEWNNCSSNYMMKMEMEPKYLETDMSEKQMGL